MKSMIEEACPACGTWTCDVCGWKRPGASRYHPQSCGRCGSITGYMVDVCHKGRRRDEHREVVMKHEESLGERLVYPVGGEL